MLRNWNRHQISGKSRTKAWKVKNKWEKRFFLNLSFRFLYLHPIQESRIPSSVSTAPKASKFVHKEKSSGQQMFTPTKCQTEQNSPELTLALWVIASPFMIWRRCDLQCRFINTVKRSVIYLAEVLLSCEAKVNIHKFGIIRRLGVNCKRQDNCVHGTEIVFEICTAHVHIFSNALLPYTKIRLCVCPNINMMRETINNPWYPSSSSLRKPY